MDTSFLAYARMLGHCIVGGDSVTNDLFHWVMVTSFFLLFYVFFTGAGFGFVVFSVSIQSALLFLFFYFE